MVVSAILYITCAILVTLWTKTEASNAACALPKAPIPIWPAGARGPANWDELWKWRSTCKDIYNITLRKTPHSSSRKGFEPTVTSDKSHHSQSTFYLPPVILYFPILRVTHSGVYGVLFARSWIFTLELILCSTVLPISDKKQGLIRLTILFVSYLWWGAGFHCDRILRLYRFFHSLLQGCAENWVKNHPSKQSHSAIRNILAQSQARPQNGQRFQVILNSSKAGRTQNSQS